MSADFSRCNRQRILLAFVACLMTAPAFAQHGAMTVPRNLDQLVKGAADIVRGNVASAYVEMHPELTNLHTVVVTLRVRETLKGVANGTYTFRQYLWDVRDRNDAAGYHKGQEYLLLMNRPSRYGLTSPAGMDQGRFRIFNDKSGRAVAVNGRANVMLFRGVGAELAREGKTLAPESESLVRKHQKGPIPVDVLTALVRELLQDGR
jgi:hypothetical protein